MTSPKEHGGISGGESAKTGIWSIRKRSVDWQRQEGQWVAGGIGKIPIQNGFRAGSGLKESWPATTVCFQRWVALIIGINKSGFATTGGSGFTDRFIVGDFD